MFVAVSRSQNRTRAIYTRPVGRWIEATKWFQHAHDSGTTSTDANFDRETLAKQFAAMEELLELMATPIAEQLGGLDEILDNANT